ncbi:MAG: VWA domain-containing protein, partial [Planctomycetes bacterium]|nr:VWA domain-containing protein [Planctomycetota bacterium]
MHWFFDYPWGPALTWLVVFAVLAVLAVSFWSIRKEIKSAAGLSVIGLRLLALAVVIFLLLQPLTKAVTTSMSQSYSGVLIDTSKSMSIRDEGKSKSRLDIAREILTPKGDDLLAKLKEKGNVRLFQFSTTLEEMPIKGIAELDKATGDSTALGSAVSQMVERFGADDLTSLVVLTDGQDNAGRAPADVARSLLVPLFVVGVGEKSEEELQDEKDYAMENVVADRRVLINRTTDVSVSVTSRGFPNRQVPIQLFLGNRLIASTAVPLGPKRPRAEGLLAYTTSTPGKYTYTVKIPVDKAELDDQNN